MIPNISIAFMTVSAVTCIGLPIFIFIYWRKKYELKVIPLLVGVAAFVVFAVYLQLVLNVLVLNPSEDGTVALLDKSPWLFVIYTIFARAIIEETGRFAAFKILSGKYTNIGTALSFGIGYCGFLTFFVGFAMVSDIYVCSLINSGDTAALSESMNLQAFILTIQGKEPAVFLIEGIERLIAMAAHISLSIIVLCSATKKGMVWLYPVAIALHAAVNLAPTMFRVGFFESIWLVELLSLLPVALCAAAAYKVCMFMGEASTPVSLEIETI
ncbi:MAG: YhfC family intramembrane metalloprotease [Oscillospiraceae bacterium]|nr:YhfC family intramembrane metalloprotease [Oscillospiraceae bacterium]